MVTKNNVQIESADSPTLTNRKNKLTQCFDDILKLSTEMLVQEQLKMVQLDPAVANGFTANQKQLLRDRIHSFHGILDDLDITLSRCTEYIETVSKIGLERERARQEELKRLEEQRIQREREEAEAQLRRQRELEEQKRKREQQELEEQEAKAKAKAKAEAEAMAKSKAESEIEVKTELQANSLNNNETKNDNNDNNNDNNNNNSSTNIPGAADMLDDMKLYYGANNDPNSLDNNKLLYSFDDQNLTMDSNSNSNKNNNSNINNSGAGNTSGPKPEPSNPITVTSPTSQRQNSGQREGQQQDEQSMGGMFGGLDPMEMSLFTDMDDPNLRTGNSGTDTLGASNTNQLDLVDTNFGANFGNDMLGSDTLGGLGATGGESSGGGGGIDSGVLNDQNMNDPLSLSNPSNGNDGNNIVGNAMNGLNDPLQDPGDEYLTLNDFNDLNIDWNASGNGGDLDLNKFNI